MSQIAYKNLSFDLNWYPLRTTAALIQRAVEIVPNDAIQDRIEALQASLKNRIDFLPDSRTSDFPKAIQAKTSGSISIGDFNGRQVFYAPIPSGSLIIDFDIKRYRVRPSLRNHLAAIPFEFVFIILGSMVLSLPIIMSLKKLTIGIESLRQADLSARVDIPLNKPLGKLALCFNEMADRVQTMLVQQRHLVQAVAHEVRTPVSRIRFHLEMLTEAEDLPELDKRITDIKEEITELKQLTDELQTFATLDTPNETISKKSFPLHEMLAETAAYFQKAHGRPSIHLMNSGAENPRITAHPVYFKRAFQNILSNAIRYARSSISIHYRVTAQGIVIDIYDDGPGIPEDARETVFNPFIRLDGSRNRGTGGFGLGLAIVQRILSLHGGSASIDSNTPQGTVITTFWPHHTLVVPSSYGTN